MNFARPAFLLLLIPWLGVVLLVFRSYRPRVLVPFLDLWPRDLPGRSKSRGWRIPPVSLVLLLLALLMGVGALASPRYQRSTGAISRFTIVVDRGVTMLAGDRLHKARERLLRELPPYLAPDAAIAVVDDDGQRQTVGPGGLAAALDRPARCLDTRMPIESILERLGQQEAGPVILLGDGSAGRGRENVVVLAADEPVRNVGLLGASAASGQVLLTLRNDSEQPSADVTIRGPGDEAEAGHELRHTLTLPPRGMVRQYTVRCPAELPLRIHLEAADDLPDDNTFWILPDRITPRLELGAGLAPAVRRFTAEYARIRPAQVVPVSATQAAKPVIRLGTPGEVGEAGRAVLVAPADRPVDLSGLAVLPDHPILRNVHLPRGRGVLATDLPLPAGEWEPLIEIEGRALLAADRSGSRVWVGFDSAVWAQEPDFVIFWTNVLQFLSPAAVTSGPRALEPTWRRVEPAEALVPELNGLRQGLYRRGEELLAVNVAAPELAMGLERMGVGSELARLAKGPAGVQIAPYLWCMTALTVVSASLALWFSARGLQAHVGVIERTV